MSEKRQTSKIFVGGLSWETTDQRLRTYFENYGAVSEAFVSFDRVTGRPRGFGFVVFEDPSIADKVVSIQHTIDRREVEAKKAVPKEDNPAGRTASGSLASRVKKVFVGGLAPSVDEQAFRKYFEQYGEVEDAVVMYDHDNKRPRGFGFVTFKSEEGVDEVFEVGALQSLHDKPIEIKRAVPRDQIASARGRTALGPGQPARLESAASGFAAAAMSASPFGDDAGFNTNLLHSHSMNTPRSQQAHNPRMASASSLNGNLPGPLFPDLAQLGISQQIYQALSGQLSGQLNNQLSGQLNGQLSGALNGQLPTGLNLQSQNSLSSGQQLLNLAHANSARMGSQHLPSTLGQLHHMNSSQLHPINGLSHHLSSEQLASAGSGLLQRNGLGLNGYSTGLPASLQGNLLGQDFSNHQGQDFQGAADFGHQGAQDFSHQGTDFGRQGAQDFSQGLQSQYTGHDNPSAFSNSANASAFSNSANDFSSGLHTAFAANTGSAFANGHSQFTPMSSQPSGLEKAFSNMGLESKTSLEANLPPPSGFEERVNMLSAGSAGLGQLTSPKLPANYGLPPKYDNSATDHQQQKLNGQTQQKTSQHAQTSKLELPNGKWTGDQDRAQWS